MHEISAKKHFELVQNIHSFNNNGVGSQSLHSVSMSTYSYAQHFPLLVFNNWPKKKEMLNCHDL